MGGLQKEFFHLIVDCIFDPSYGMFKYIEESRTLWIDCKSYIISDIYVLGLINYNIVTYFIMK